VNCPKCRAEHDRAARFCEECGARLETTCSNCGKPLTPGKKFCRSCGAPAASADSFESNSPALYTPAHVAEKILTSRNAVEGERKRAAWPYVRAWPEVARVSNFVSFEPDKVEVFLDDRKLVLETGQGVKAHGIDRSLDPDEMLKQGSPTAHS
jgi:hypothetical protein